MLARSERNHEDASLTDSFSHGFKLRLAMLALGSRGFCGLDLSGKNSPAGLRSGLLSWKVMEPVAFNPNAIGAPQTAL